MKNIYRFLLVTVAAVLMAVNINTFVHIGGLLPGGFSGITLLIQEVFKTYLNISIPYSIVCKVIHVIKESDPGAFVNILQTKVLKGNFFMKKND